MTPKAQATKHKYSQMGLHQWSEIISRVKKQLVEWEKTFAMHISDKYLISRKYKEHLQNNIERQVTKLKMGKGLNRY